MLSLFDILIVAAILGFAYWGWLVGLEAASVAALELLACLTVAVMLHEAAAGVLHLAATTLLGDWAGQAWSILLAFAALAWGTFALVRLQLHRQRSDDDHAEAEIDPLSDRLGGAVAGGLGGAVFAGGVLITLSMVPFLAGLKPSGDRLLLDVGKLVLRAGGQYATDRHEGRSLPLEGEPPSRMTVASARLASEPWFDVDDDGKCTEADRFRDVDSNGTFTKDLYFADVDNDGLRRVGLVDKYVAGRWDGLLMSEDRPRPDLKKPAPKPSTTKARPSPAKPTTSSSRPVESQPGKSQPGKSAAGEQRPAETKRPATKPPPGPKPKSETPQAAPEQPAAPPAGKLPEDDF